MLPSSVMSILVLVSAVIFWMTLPPEPMTARGSPFSLLPLGTARGVSIRGCYYLIDDYTLESDTSRGMSNVVTADEAVITVREGDLLLFHYSDIHGHGESA